MQVRLALGLATAASTVALLGAQPPAVADNGCSDPGTPGSTSGSVSLPRPFTSPWTIREADPTFFVQLQDQQVDSSSATLSITKPDGTTVVLRSPFTLKIAGLPNGDYTVVAHWAEPCYGPDQYPTGETVPAQTPPFTFTLAIPPPKHADARFFDVFRGAKFHVGEISVGQYCNQDPDNYRDEPFTITAYFTTTGSAPTTSSPSFSDSSAHGCAIERGRERPRKHSRKFDHGLISAGGQNTGGFTFAVTPSARVRVLVVAKSGGEVVAAARVRFVPSVVHHTQPRHYSEKVEQAKTDSGTCPGGCSALRPSP
jgi:hypothetical protein